MIVLKKDKTKLEVDLKNPTIRGVRVRSVTLDHKDIEDLFEMLVTERDVFLYHFRTLKNAMFEPIVENRIMPDNQHEQELIDAGMSAKCSMQLVEVDDDGNVIGAV